MEKTILKTNHQHCDQCGDAKFNWLYNRIKIRQAYWKKNEDDPEHYGFEFLNELESLLEEDELRFNK